MPVSVYYFNKIIITHNNFSSKLYLVLQSEPKTTKTPLANKTRIQIFVILSFKILFTFFNEVVDHVDRIKVNI